MFYVVVKRFMITKNSAAEIQIFMWIMNHNLLSWNLCNTGLKWVTQFYYVEYPCRQLHVQS